MNTCAKIISQIFTEDQVKFITENYPVMNRNELLTALNKRFESAYSKNQLVGFLKRKKISSGRTGKFKKGSVSWNDGLKGVLKPNSGSFKKGNIPANTLPVGTERINDAGYIEVKTAAPNKWEFKHLLVWEEHYGKVARGFVVRFKDGNKLNTTIGNLTIASKSEHVWMNINDLLHQPAEVRDTVELLLRLQSKTHSLERVQK
ncbi:HNH endonuclease signature motif containing protein [Pseudoalteromonas piscicida]